MGVGQREADIEFIAAQFPADTPSAVAVIKCKNLVNGWMIAPESLEFGVSEQRDMCVGPRFAETQQRGRGHHGVTQPVDAANQDALISWHRVPRPIVHSRG